MIPYASLGWVAIKSYRQRVTFNRRNHQSDALQMFIKLTLSVAWWSNGKMSELQSKGCGFDSPSGNYQVVTTWMDDCL